MISLDDAELLHRYAAEKSEAAFAELVRRHVNPVYAFALRRVGGDAHLAEDVVQIVFTTLARKAAALTDRAVLGGWLCRATHFAARDAVRAEHCRRTREQAAHTMDESSAGDDRAKIDWEKIQPVLNETMGELNDADRDAVWLRFFEDRSFAEVGVRLRLTENTARMRVERALEKLHAALMRRGVTSTAAAVGLALASQAVTAAPVGFAASVTGAALASAGSVGGVAGFLTFMSTTKIVSSAAVAIALLAIISAVRESSEARASAAALNAVAAERDSWRAQAKTLAKRAQQSDDNAAAAQRELAEQRAATAAPADAASVQAAAWQNTSPVNYALDHPEARAAFVEQEVARAKAKFDRFFRLAGLSAAEQEKFLGVLKNFAEAKLDLTASVRAQGYGPYNVPQDPEALRALFKVDAQVDAEFMGDLRGLLGEEHFKQFLNERKALPETNVVDQLASQLYDSDTPLSALQAQQLRQLLRENRFEPKAAPSPTNTLDGTVISGQAFQAAMGQSNLVHGDIMMPGIDWTAPVTDAAIARAGTLLNPAQVAALRRFQAQQAARLRLAPPAPQQPDIAALPPKRAGEK